MQLFAMARTAVTTCALTFVIVSTASASPEKSEDSALSVKLGYDHTVGKYGLQRDSEADTSSFSAVYDTDNYSFDLLVPYLKQTGPGRLQAIAGQRGRVVIVSGPALVATGIGDVTAGITRYLLNEEDHGVDFDLGANYKF